MNNNWKKKAFTLTELLVVVIVIGVLSAVVLPKFSKVIETRKTTEAEEMMAAVRTEQEKRCALDKAYTTDAATVNLTSLNTKNFNYTLKNTGMEAASKGKYGYTLKMPSYRDGRLCCDSAEQCAKLNKNYPLCSELTAKADYTSGAECAAGGEEPDIPPTYECTDAKVVSRSCQSGCGTETRSATCNTSNGQWEYSAWNTSGCTPQPAAETKACEAGYSGTQTRSAVCKNGAWVMGDWTGTCTLVCDMSSRDVLNRAQNCEQGGHNPNWQAGTWSTDTCSCTCPAGTTMDDEGACIVKGSCQTDMNEREDCERSLGTWNLDTCACVCPTGTTYDSQSRACVNPSCNTSTYKANHKSECCPYAPTTDTVCWKTEWIFDSSSEEYWFPNTGPHGDRTCDPEYTNAPRTDENCNGSCSLGDTCTYLANYSFWNTGDTDCVGLVDTFVCRLSNNGW